MDEWIKDKVVQGLYIRKRDSGESWVIKSRIKGGNPITITIGKKDLFNITKARQIAKAHLALLAQGINSNEKAKKARAVAIARDFPLTKAIEQYSDSASWKEKTRSDALSTFKRHFSDWYSRPLASITKEEVQAKFKQIKTTVAYRKAKRDRARIAKGLPVKTSNNEVGRGEAQRAFRYLAAIFNNYTQDDAGEEKLLPKGNPCDVLKAKKLRKTLTPKDRFLNQIQRDNLYELLSSLDHDEHPGSITREDEHLVWLLIHTGLRLDEALTMKWSSVNLEEETFTAINTKNGRNHKLPMTEATKTIFNYRHRTRGRNTYVFSSPVNKKNHMTASRTFQRLSSVLGFEFTAHDLRRTVATVASDLGYDLNAIGDLLNHTRQGVTAGYVQHTHTRIKRILEDIETGLFTITQMNY